MIQSIGWDTTCEIQAAVAFVLDSIIPVWFHATDEHGSSRFTLQSVSSSNPDKTLNLLFRSDHFQVLQGVTSTQNYISVFTHSNHCSTYGLQSVTDHAYSLPCNNCYAHSQTYNDTSYGSPSVPDDGYSKPACTFTNIIIQIHKYPGNL